MRKLLTLFFLFSVSIVYCQSGNKLQDSTNNLAQQDSALTILKQQQDSLTHALPPVDTIAIQQSVDNSVKYFEQLQKENRNKQKNAAIRNIAIGVVILVVLVIGLRRKPKK